MIIIILVKNVRKVADAENNLARKDVVVGWVDGDETVVLSGIEDLERLITTPISYPIYGSPLTILEGE